MKFVHYVRDCFFGEGEVVEQAGKLNAILDPRRQRQADWSVRELLQIYRGLERAPKLNLK